MHDHIIVSDDIELDAQIPAKVSSGEGQSHLATRLFDIQKLRFQGNGIYRGDSLSKWKGKLSIALCSPLISPLIMIFEKW